MKKKKAEAPENHERWLVSYADFMTLLFALFVVLYSFAMAKQSEARVIIQGFIESLGKIGLISPPAGSPVMQGGTGILEPDSHSHINGDEKSSVIESDNKPASDPINETIGHSEQADPNNSWPHPAPQSSGWVKESREKLDQQLKSEIDKKEIEVEQLGDELIIRIGERTLFPADSAYLQPQFIPLVERVATVLADIPGQITVSGHTDNTQPPAELYQSNWELSVLRAASIVHVLIKDPQLDATRIIAQGKADTHPRFPNDTQAHREGNRRVEITLTQGTPTEQSLPLLKKPDAKRSG
ncbi:MotB family protein [Aeromonas sp. R6-2]|uniref:MotB family protein n=1 Tax=unclassified Aeromonas TaxID=257493 RepID=UPI0034A27ACC